MSKILVTCCLFLSITLFFGTISVLGQQRGLQKRDLLLKANQIEHKMSLSMPRGWSVEPQIFQNSYSLTNATSGDPNAPSAHIQVQVEPRLDHEDALNQMREFASVVSEANKSFSRIGGWPAIQISRLEWRPQPSQGPRYENPKALQIQTYIAVADVLVVVSANLPPDAKPDLVEQTLAIAAGLGFESSGDPAQVDKDLQKLKEPLKRVPGFSAGRSPARDSANAISEVKALVAVSGANERIDAAGRGELEIAVSPDGLNVVVALQSRRWVSSNDGGATFPNSGTVGSGNGDPSVAYGQSGNFYIAWIDSNCGTNYLNFNVGTLPSQPFGYDCTGIARSTNSGMTFQTNTVNPAVVCIGRAPPGGTDPAGACFPDQEHIAADRVNPGGGGDQVYSTWRNFNAANQNAGLVCTQDSGVNWTLPISLGANSFFPRITVGQDGFVYVAAYSGGFYRLWKYSSCANGLNLQAGFPVNVATRSPYDCPFAGHDRCDQNPSSQTVAVDDTDPNHIYYAFAEDAGGAGSDSNIIVRDSLDGGQTWPAARVVQASPAVSGRRIMPWMCATGSDAVLTWFEQRDPVPSDSTDFFGARVGLDALDSLVSKEVFLISEVADNWCDSGWDCGTRFAFGDTNTDNAAEACPIQPQLAGRCGDNTANTPDSNVPCDFSDEAAAPGSTCPQAGTSPSGNNEICEPRGGCPKYGDYSGIACTGAKLFAAWPSAASPPGVPPPNSPTITGALFDVINLDIEVPVITVPGGVQFDGTCNGSTSFETLEVCNTGLANLQVDVISSDNAVFTVSVPSSGFPVTISPDFCFPFEVAFAPSGMEPASALLSIPSNDPSRPTVQVEATATVEEQQIVTIFDSEYGNVCLGDTLTKQIRIQNSGGCDLTVADISSSNGEFALATVMTFPLVIGPGAEVSVPIEFAPVGDTNPESSTISIIHDGFNTPSPKQLTANGTSEPAEINAFLANSGSFGEVCAGDFLDLNLTVQNDGACPLEIDSASIVLGANAQAGDFVQPDGNAAGIIIEPANSVQIPFRFSPASFDTQPPATRAASIEVGSHTQNASATLPTATTPIQGVVPPPDIQLAIANSGDFGKTCKTEHSDLTLTLFNQGKCDLAVSNIELLPEPQSFELPTDLTLPLVLSPDAAFELPVRFSPEECFDTPEAVTVKITSDDPDEMMVNVNVSGASPCPNLVIDPTGLSGLFAFPATVVDTDGTLNCFSERSLNLRNNSECPLTIENISAAGADFSVIQPSVFPLILPTGEEAVAVTVRFTPQSDTDPLAPSEVTGTLTVVSDDPDAVGLAELCGESAFQSGLRVLVTDQSGIEPVPLDEVESIRISSKGIHSPGPINLRFTDQPLGSAIVCGKLVQYHVDQETLPSTDTTGNNPGSSYTAKAKQGNLQSSESFPLAQCEFLDFQLQLENSNSETCTLGQKGDSCTTDGECCSGKCRGPSSNKTCK